MRKAVQIVALLLTASATSLQPFRLAAITGGSENPVPQTQVATLRMVASRTPDIPFDQSDLQSEELLLQLANRERAKVGAQVLKLDEGLSQAARVHAQAMLEARKLSHQFEGEPSVAQRLAEATSLQLDQEAENAAFDYDAADGHKHLMLSPPHRENLLNPAYNVVGLGVVHSGDRLYIVEDFGHALPNSSVDDVKARVASAVVQMRRAARKPALQRDDLANADDVACSMAQADKLGTSPIHQLAQHYTVLTFTSLHPETLPAETKRAVTSHNLHTYSVGACYARTETYPTGVYWVVLSLD
jgi:uncharacterized protein YkwD